MALIKCPECEKEISDKSTTCIHCGYPLEKNQESDNESISSENDKKYKMVLKSDKNKIATIKLIMELKKLSLVDGKNIVDNCPITIFDNLSLDEARQIESSFIKIDSDIEVIEQSEIINLNNSSTVIEQKETKQINKEATKQTINTTPSTNKVNQNNKGCMIAVIIAIVIFFIVIMGSEEDHDDGKCDICGKKATCSSDSYEFCTEHYIDAVDYYYKEVEPNENYGGF